jgi:hypothetical protein
MRGEHIFAGGSRARDCWRARRRRRLAEFDSHPKARTSYTLFNQRGVAVAVRFSALLVAAFSMSLGACASITAGTSQTIAVATAPKSSASCELSNEKGRWTVPATPGSTTVSKAYGSLTITCAHPEGDRGSATLESTTAGAAFGNILVGGIIGAAVDMSSGAAYTYPASLTVALAPPMLTTNSVSRSGTPSAAAVRYIAPPGTRAFSDGGGYIEILEVNDEYVKTVNSEGQVARWYGGFFAIGENTSLQFDRGKPNLIWPLEVGKSIQFHYSDARHRWKVDLIVARQEPLVVSAKTYNSFVVERHTQGEGANYHRSIRSYWYVHELGIIAKYEPRLLAGTWGGGTPPVAWNALSVSIPSTASFSPPSQPSAQVVTATPQTQVSVSAGDTLLNCIIPDGKGTRVRLTGESCLAVKGVIVP